MQGRLEVSGCGGNELVDACPCLLASLPEIGLVAAVGDIDSAVDGARREAAELVVR